MPVKNWEPEIFGAAIGFVLALAISLLLVSCEFANHAEDCSITIQKLDGEDAGNEDTNMPVLVNGSNTFSDVYAPENGEAADASDLLTTTIQPLTDRTEYLSDKLDQDVSDISNEITLLQQSFAIIPITYKVYPDASYLEFDAPTVNPAGTFSVIGNNRDEIFFPAGYYQVSIVLSGESAALSDSNQMVIKHGIGRTSFVALVASKHLAGTDDAHFYATVFTPDTTRISIQLLNQASGVLLAASSPLARTVYIRRIAGTY